MAAAAARLLRRRWQQQRRNGARIIDTVAGFAERFVFLVLGRLATSQQRHIFGRSRLGERQRVERVCARLLVDINVVVVARARRRAPAPRTCTAACDDVMAATKMRSLLLCAMSSSIDG